MQVVPQGRFKVFFDACVIANSFSSMMEMVEIAVDTLKDHILFQISSNELTHHTTLRFPEERSFRRTTSETDAVNRPMRCTSSAKEMAALCVNMGVRSAIHSRRL